MIKKAQWLMITLVSLPFLAYYLGTPPNQIQWQLIKSTAALVGIVVAYCFIVGQLTGNNSQVDKLWSVVPVVYTWYMTAHGGWKDRMVLMSVLVSLWGIRLTYNFARRGAYSWKFWAGEEDYRWEILRKKPGFNNPWVWMIFNLLFICFYQNTLIFLFTLPVLSSLHINTNPLGWMDMLLALVFLVLLAIEFIADQQQFNFQQEKYRRLKAGEELGTYAEGFVRTGLWSFSRHHKFAAVEGIWLVFYMFSVAATGVWLNWSVVGSVLLVLLFKGSSDFSEEISASKYPAYKTYQESVPRFLPRIGKIRELFKGRA
jgi:steroid 5-alpha reductase family enzyme